MTKYIFTLLILVSVALIYIKSSSKGSASIGIAQPTDEAVYEKRLDEKLYPFEGHFLDKNYPETNFASDAYREVLESIAKSKNTTSRNETWVNQGPGNIGGRVNTIAVDPKDDNHILLGYSIGGIFETKDGGENWRPIFDDQATLSISDITFDPDDSNTLYVATGDHNISGYPTSGMGVYKSIDGGVTWSNIGLTEAGVISEIGISQDDPNILYVATMGLPFVRNEHRGLYKSTDKGLTWDKVFYINDSTGVIDIEIDPTDHDIVYASTWTRIRNNRESILASNETGIYKTTDGGATWTMLTNGLPSGELVRPGLAMYYDNPNILFASFVKYNTVDSICSTGHHLEGIYMTVDQGSSWTAIPTGEETGLPCTVLGGFGWYFGKISVNPSNPNHILLLGVDLYETKNAGNTWEMLGPPWWTYEVHADKHEAIFLGNDILLGTDGGAYRYNADIQEWADIEDNVTTQFYRVGVSPFMPGQYFGGAQDNGTSGGSIDDVNNWPRIYGGDGFQITFRPDMDSVFYVETQNGRINVTTDGGESFSSANFGLSGSRNWDMQYIISPHNPDVMYTGTDKMFRSITGVFPNWEEISDNLTDTLDKSTAFSHTISTVDQSPVDPDVLYCGVSDGFVWRSLDGGAIWERVNGSLPRRYISDIKASPESAEVVYLSIQGYRDNDFTPYIYKSNDNGSSWTSIQGNLPQIAINDILVRPSTDDMTIFVGTDGGVFVTIDGGISWERLGDNMPIMPIYDMVIDAQDQLVVGSFARGIYTYDLSQLISSTYEKDNIEPSFLISTLVTDELIMVESLDGLKFEIFSTSGSLLHYGKVIHSRIDVSHLPQGYYFIRIEGIKSRASSFLKM